MIEPGKNLSSEGHTSAGPRPRALRRDWVKLVLVLSLCTAFALFFAFDYGVRALPAEPRTESSPAGFDPAAAQGSDKDYSRFTHANSTHAQLPCLLCHRRDDNSARPAMPGRNGHLPCIGCHTQQFARSDGPMCAICHTNAGAAALKPFPRLRSFNMRFDHATHLSGAARGGGGAACATCHKQQRGGVALSIPAGFGAHSTCFQCHSPRAQGASGRDISSCGVCHQQGPYRRTPTSAAAYRVNFSHAKHGAGRSLGCNECHNVRAGMPQSRQVTSPLPLNHHAPPRAQSCMTCHNGKRAFGGEDFSSCKRCHQGTAWHF